MKDSDLIRRSDAENIFRNARRAMKPENYSGQEFFIRDNILLNAEQIVHALPAVDAVEVCRCGQCQFTETDCADAIYCQRWDRWEMELDGYCAWGRRREDGDGDG